MKALGEASERGGEEAKAGLRRRCGLCNFDFMSAAEILNELPNLNNAERHAIVRRVFELEADREELNWAAQAADAAFQELDRLEEQSAPPSPR